MVGERPSEAESAVSEAKEGASDQQVVERPGLETFETAAEHLPTMKGV